MLTSINAKPFIDVLKNTVAYSQAFLQESKQLQSKVSEGIADESIDGFYDYLDMLARVHPDMLHHVYEWGEVGNPEARLFELKRIASGNKQIVSSEFLPSRTVEEGSNEPFVDKARIMEDGIPVVIDTVNAEALFFEIDGEEYFRTGPIIIENPGGEATRGSFVRAFEEFYGSYFQNVYLKSIPKYKALGRATAFAKNFGAVKRGNARSAGKAAARSWLLGDM